MNDLTAPARPPLDAESMLAACRQRQMAGTGQQGGGQDPRAVAVAEYACPRGPASLSTLPAADALYRRLKLGTLALQGAQWPREPQIAALVAQLRDTLQPDPLHTIAVLLPWQPPGVAGAEVDAGEYLRLARRLMIRYPGSRLWVQTVDQAAWCQFRDVFGERCSNVWVADGSPSLGRTPAPGFAPADWADDARVSDLQWALLRLLAECRFLVTHTGEWGLWASLLHRQERGHGRGVWQVDARAGAINPAWPGGWVGACRRWLKRR